MRSVPGLLGALWLVGGLGYIFWTRALSAALSTLGKSLLSGICLGGIAFAISAMLPFKGQERIRAGDVGDFWSFVRGPAPEDELRLALWRKFRRSVVILMVTVVFMLAWFIAGSLGLAKA